LVSSSLRTTAFSDVDAERVGELVARRPAAVDAVEVLDGPLDVALPAADRPRRPVLAAHLVEHRAVDPRPGVLLERRALRRVVPVDGMDHRLQADRDEVLGLHARRHLADLAVDDELDERCERQDEAVPQALVARLLVLAPELVELLRSRPPGAARRACGHVLPGTHPGKY
jgi:hypothetical protein